MVGNLGHMNTRSYLHLYKHYTGYKLSPSNKFQITYSFGRTKISFGPWFWVPFSFLSLFKNLSFILWKIESYNKIELPKVTGPRNYCFWLPWKWAMCKCFGWQNPQMAKVTGLDWVCHSHDNSASSRLVRHRYMYIYISVRLCLGYKLVWFLENDINYVCKFTYRWPELKVTPTWNLRPSIRKIELKYQIEGKKNA